jgi:hypothetical protein
MDPLAYNDRGGRVAAAAWIMERKHLSCVLVLIN